MTESMAKESESVGIRVNSILPEFIETPMTDKIPDKIKEKILSTIPIGRIKLMDEVAQICLFLASNKMSSYVNGASSDATDGF